MEQDLLKKAQQVQLEILKEVKRVCIKHNIEFWLDSGTLLGAVRHEGYIPWDDDTDIGMMREQYNKFIEIAPRELDKKYIIQTWHNTDKFGSSFAKIRKKGTKYIESNMHDAGGEQGFWVDVFPYDVYIKDNRYNVAIGFWLEQLKRLIFMKTGRRQWQTKNGIKWWKWVGYLPYRFVSCFFSRTDLIKKYEKIRMKYNSNTSVDYLYELGDRQFGKWVIPKDCFDELIMLRFEDDIFPCPKGYDKYLTAAYGDYMKLPPTEKRTSLHEIIHIDFGNDRCL